MGSPYQFLGLNIGNPAIGAHQSRHLPPGMPGGMSSMNPMMNDQPLQFNKNKGKPPMTIMGDIQEVKDMDLEKNGTPDPVSSSNQDMNGMPPMLGPGLIPGGMGFNPMMGDPSMMGLMGPFGQYPGFVGPMPPMGMQPPPKEVIHCKECTLVPPPPNAPPPSTRERPPGCRTIFVGGLPETCTEDILRDVFDQMGPVVSIRVSKKNFAHIRYETCDCVERALFLSGYRMKIGDKDDKPSTGRLHVDYAEARDDYYEYECQQRALAREQRHRQRAEESRLRGPSPPAVVHYSEHEASSLSEKLKDDSTFMRAAQVLVTWLDRGECSQRSANRFYSMIQSVNSHVRRLMNEKSVHEDELLQMKELFRKRMEGVLRQLDQIDKVFTVASKQKAWDHFSKAQRKNLELWRKQTQELKTTQQEEFLSERQEAEMEMSDSDSEAPPKKKQAKDTAGTIQISAQYKEDNESLRCQLEAYKNEVDLLKTESKNTLEQKDKQITALQQALQGMQQQLIQSKEESKRQTEKKENEPSTVTVDLTKSDVPTTSTLEYSTKEAKLIGVISTFLHVHPFGASVDYIWSYLQRLNISIRSSEIEDILEKVPSVFRQDLYGVGASIEKRWRFIGLEISEPKTS